MIALLSSFLPGCFLSERVLQVFEHEIFPFFPFRRGIKMRIEPRTSLFIISGPACDAIVGKSRLIMLRSKSHQSLRSIHSISTTLRFCSACCCLLLLCHVRSHLSVKLSTMWQPRTTAVVHQALPFLTAADGVCMCVPCEHTYPQVQ